MSMVQGFFVLTLACCGTATGWAAANPSGQKLLDEAFLVEADKQCRQGKGDYLQHLVKLHANPKNFTLRELSLINNPEFVSAAIAGEQALACLEFVGGKGYSCASLLGLEANYRGHAFCQELRTLLSYAASLFQKGDEEAAFQAYFPRMVENENIPAALKARAKGALADAFRKGNTQEMCALVVKNNWVSNEQCASGLMFLLGDPLRCASMKLSGGDKPRSGLDMARVVSVNEGVERGYCSEKASLLSGLRSQDPAACSASPLCVAVTRRSPSACEPLVRKANQGFCGRVASLAAPAVKVFQEGAAKAAAVKAKEVERQRREAQVVAEHEKKRLAEEKLLKQQVAAEEIRKAQDAAAKDRRLDTLVRKNLEEKNQKFQYRDGERMDAQPLDVMESLRAVNQGKVGPPAKPLYPDESK
ncbi:MAG: hypothetical protein WC943_05300 [Elusimicrobiota bacterium]|jgi:hypothetical protein